MLFEQGKVNDTIGSLFGIELHDQLFLHRHCQLVAARQTLNNAFELSLLKFQPLGDSPPNDRFQGLIDALNIFTFFVNHDLIADLNQIGWNIHPRAVDDKMIVANKVASLVTGIAKAQSIDHIVQAPFQHNEQVGSGNTFLSVRFFEKQMKLFFGKPVDPLDFLLFA